MSTTRTYKTISVSFPPDLLKELDAVAKKQYRGKSEILRTAFLDFLGRGLQSEPMSKTDETDVRDLLADIRNGNTVSYTTLRHELGVATR